MFPIKDPLRVGATAKAPEEIKGEAGQDLPLPRSIKRTSTSALQMTVIAMCHPKNTNIPTKERNIHVPGV